MTLNKYASLALWILVFEAVSFLIGQATQPGVDGWYAGLTPPPLSPPNIAFPVMWTILYALIAAAGWTLWRNRDGQGVKTLLFLFAGYMALNWSWSFVFFGAHMLLAGFLWIAALNILALAFIYKAWTSCRPAAYFMIPPTLWTSFAMYLNGGYWWLNV